MDDRSAMPDVAGTTTLPDGEAGEQRRSSARSDPTRSITSIIEHQVLPRLVLSHRAELIRPRIPTRNDVLHPTPAHILAELVIDHDITRAERFLVDLRASGKSIEALYLDYLAPAARYLGELWASDHLTFTQVTVGTGRLQQLLYQISDDFEADSPIVMHCRRVLLAPTPGEQHTFGLTMVASYFRRAGWDVGGGARCDEAGLIDAVRCPSARGRVHPHSAPPVVQLRA